MKTVTKYITNDGIEFLNKEEAELHEQTFQWIRRYPFWLDGGFWRNLEPSISGSTVRQRLPDEKRSYNIYVESNPDKLVQDGDTFMLPQRFYARPNGVRGG